MGTFARTPGLSLVLFVDGSMKECASQASAKEMVDILLLNIEQTHSSRDAHQHVLRDVDLHQNKQLVESAEDVSNWAQVDPLVSIEAKKMLLASLNILPVHDKVS